jgi:hypothetical protein
MLLGCMQAKEILGFAIAETEPTKLAVCLRLVECREPYSGDHKCIVTLGPVPKLRSTMHNDTMALLMH